MKVLSIVALACYTSATKLRWFDPVLFETANLVNTEPSTPSVADEAKMTEENK